MRLPHNESLSAASRALPSAPKSTWGCAALHPRAGSPAEQLGWGARLYAVARYRGLTDKFTKTRQLMNES